MNHGAVASFSLRKSPALKHESICRWHFEGWTSPVYLFLAKSHLPTHSSPLWGGELKQASHSISSRLSDFLVPFRHHGDASASMISLLRLSCSPISVCTEVSLSCESSEQFSWNSLPRSQELRWFLWRLKIQGSWSHAWKQVSALRSTLSLRTFLGGSVTASLLSLWFLHYLCSFCNAPFDVGIAL